MSSNHPDDSENSKEAPALSGDAAPPWITPLLHRSIRWAIAAILLTLATLWFVGQERNLVGYLILAELLALALEPAVIWMHEHRGWRRGSATGLLLVVVLVAMILLGVGVATVLARETSQILQQLPSYVDKLNAFTQTHFHTIVFSPAQRAAAAHAATHINDFMKQHQADILGGISSGLSAVFSLFTIGLFTFYLTAQGPQVRRALLSRMPPERQKRILFAWETAIKKMGGYLYSRLLLASINGTLMFVTLKILGVPYALPLALVSGLVAEFIPIVGTYIGGALPAIVAIAENGPTAATVVVIESVIYQQFENYYLSPRISAKTIELNAGVAFGAAMAGGAVGGFVGAFFALPIAATIQAFMTTYSRTFEVTESALTDIDTPHPPSSKRPKRGGGRRRHGGEAEVGSPRKSAPDGADPP